MGNPKRLLIGLVLLVAVGACTNDSDNGAKSELSEKATDITDQLIANDWPAVRKDFDDTMESQLSEPALEAAWRQVTAPLGAFKALGEPTRYKKRPANIETFEVPITFEGGSIKARISFRRDGSVAGLYLLEPSAP